MLEDPHTVHNLVLSTTRYSRSPILIIEACLCVSLSVCLAGWLSVCPSVGLSDCLSVCLSLSVSLCLVSLPPSLSVSLSLSLSLYCVYTHTHTYIYIYTYTAWIPTWGLGFRCSGVEEHFLIGVLLRDPREHPFPARRLSLV